MADLESRIVDALIRIQSRCPEHSENMFVFPLTLMTSFLQVDRATEEIVEDDVVAMVCRVKSLERETPERHPNQPEWRTRPEASVS